MRIPRKLDQPVTEKVQWWVLAAASAFYLIAMFFIARNRVGNHPILEDPGTPLIVVGGLGLFWLLTIVAMRELLGRPIWVRSLVNKGKAVKLTKR